MLKDNIIVWWQNLAERERTLLAICVAFIVLFFGYSVMWRPLSTTVSNYQTDVKTQHDLLLYLQAASDKVAAFRQEGVQPAASMPAHENLLSLTETTIAQHQLSPYLKQVSQDKADQVVLVFQKVPMDDLAGWLQRILTMKNVKLDSFVADRLPVVGTADVKMSLETV